MNEEILTRVATMADTNSLVEFNQAMAFETERKYLDAQVLQSGVEAVLRDERKGFYAVAESEGKIVGGLMVTFEWSDWRDKWFWWIQSVYVLPEKRGRGVYRRLYEFVKHQAQMRRDVCGFRLYVERENAAAQGVYEKLGMAESHYLMFEEML
ncbi:MAG: GNAT family N-acetyltransferase [Pyrinomonadaceae bacterium]